MSLIQLFLSKFFFLKEAQGSTLIRLNAVQSELRKQCVQHQKDVNNPHLKCSIIFLRLRICGSQLLKQERGDLKAA